MAKSFRRGNRTTPSAVANKNSVSPRALRNNKAREANKNKSVKTSDGKTYKDYNTYKRAVEHDNKVKERLSTKDRPVNDGSSLRTRSNVSDIFKEYRERQVEIRNIEKEITREERLEALRASNDVMAKHAMSTDNPLLMRQAAITENIVLEENGKYTPGYEDATSDVARVLSGEYMNGVVQKDWDDWYEKNTYVDIVSDGPRQICTRKLRANAAPPPVGYNEKGETVDISGAWRYYQQVDNVRNITNKSKEDARKEKASMYANHADQELDTYNSNLDAFIGLMTGHGLEGFKEFYSQYIIKPLKHGNFSALGLNLLNDLGETLDALPRGVKAALASQRGVYGDEDVWKNKAGTSFTNQKSWVYTGGKKLQKQLIRLGALKVVDPKVGDSMAEREKFIQAIKDAGLWEEYLKFEEEYKIAEIGRLDLKAVGEYMKEAYTTHKNYEADTGNIAADLALELATDPTLFVGAMNSVSKTALRRMSDEALTNAFKVVNVDISTLDEFTGLKLNTLTKNLSEDLLSKGSKEIEHTAKTIAEELRDKGVFTTDVADKFKDALIRNTQRLADEKAFTVVKSLHYANKTADKIDATLLKTVFAVPYAGIKVGKPIVKEVAVPAAKKAVEVGTLKFDVFKKAYFRRIGEEVIDVEDNTVHAIDAGTIIENMKKEALPQEHPEVTGATFDIIKRGIEKECNQIDSIINNNWKTVAEMEQAVSEYVQEITKGKYADFAGYVNHIEELNQKYITLEDSLYYAKKQYDRYLEQKRLVAQGPRPKEKIVSGKAQIPLVEEDKLIDKAERLSGDLRERWVELTKSFKDLPDGHEFKTFFSGTRRSAPTLKEARFVVEKMLQQLHWQQTIGNPVDSAQEQALRDFYNNLIETKLSVDVQESLQFNNFQRDKWVAFEDAISSTYFKKVLDLFGDPKSSLYKFLDKFSSMDSVDTPQWVTKHIYELIEQIKSYNAFQTFKRKLELDSGPLTDDQVYRVLDTLFNRDFVTPHALTDTYGKEMNTFINKIEVGLAALDDTESFALDNFRRIATDFSGDIWGKYSKEIEDPAIQARVRELLKGGHEDPTADVNVQILQTILRDPDAIVRYNQMSKEQDVIFYDIETRGLNNDSHEITCVAMKTWEPLSDEATLDEILTYLEKEGKYYQTYTDEAYLKEVINNDILEVNYKNRADIAPTREARLPHYLKRFGAESNGKTVTEYDICNKIVGDLDTSYKARNNKAPVLIAHNNNNFDADFICKRMIVNGTYPSHMRNLDEFIGQEQNTYQMLRTMFPSSTLSPEQSEYIRRVVADYAREMGEFNTSMRVFQPGKFVQSIREFVKADSSGDESFRFAQDELAELEVDDIQRAFLDDISADSTVFGLNPYYRTVESLDDETIIKYFGKDRIDTIRAMSNEDLAKLWLKEVYHRDVKGSDSLMRMNKDKGPLDKVPYFGYRNATVNQISNYFNIVGKRVPQRTLQKMNAFAKACGRDVTKRLQSNALLLGHLDEFKAVIEYVQSFAAKLDVYDELHYLSYAQAPESVEEAYMMAQRMWDMFTGTTYYEQAIKHLEQGTEFNKIPEEIRGTAIALSKFKDDFDIGSVVSPDVKARLSNEGERFHHQIFKDVYNEDAYYLEMIEEDRIIQNAIINKYKKDERTLTTASLIYESNSTTKAKDLMLTTLLTKSREAVERFINYDSKAKAQFKRECKTVYSKMIDAHTAQIMGKISKSQKNLIEHLLYNNQHVKVATKGSELHMAQLADLMKVLEQESEYLYHTVDNQGYLWIGLKKEWQAKVQIKGDSAHLTDETEITFFGRPEVYHRPNYGRITMPEDALSDKTMVDFFRVTEEQVYNLSRGASAGSLGIAHSMSKQRQIYNNAPEDFLRNTFDVEFTCNERFWHNANYDMSNLGSMKYRWKVGNQNEVDYLIAVRKTLEETAKKTQTERMFIHGIFGAQEQLRIQDVFPDNLTDLEIAQGFKETKDMVCLVLKESKYTESGFFVEAVDTTTARGVKHAKEANAIVVPYSMYSTIGGAINESKAFTGMLKVYAKVLHLYKTGYLFSPGTWVRNAIDGTMKAIADTGDATGLLTNYLHAGVMLRKYNKATRTIAANRGVNHNTMADLERMWDTWNLDLSFEEFKFMDEWMRRDESGGESQILKVVKERRNMQSVNKVVRKKNDGFDLVEDSLLKFEMLSEKEARNFFNRSKLGEATRMTEDEFADIFTKRVIASPAQRMEYESIAKTIMSQKIPYKYSVGSAVQGVNDMMFCPMSFSEEIIRLGEFMTLEQQGYTQSQIFQKITASQFNYNLKSPATRHLELVIPFYTFMHDNLIYWCRQVNDNPRMLRYIEKIWGELSWDTSDYEPEEIIYNDSLQYAMLSGSIPLSNTGFMFKANPAFLSAFNFMYKPVEELYGQLFQPFQNFIQDRAEGSDARKLFGEQVFWNNPDSIGEVIRDTLSSDTPWKDGAKYIGRNLPIVQTMLTRYWDRGPDNAVRLPEGVPLQKFLVEKFPDAFGVIKNYKKEYAFTKDGLSWEERLEQQARKGKLWDYNQGKFVKMSEFIPGGLNREFDFDKEGEWELFCQYKKKYFGLVWDNNVRDFVKPEDKTVGGLNDPDATWEEVMYYNARLGLFWNQDEGKFIDISEWPLKEQKILRYTFFGEKYDEKSETWVQVTNPAKGFGTTVIVEVTEHDIEEESMLARIGIIATAYAAEPELVRQLVRVPSKYFEATQDDLDSFMRVMEKIGYQNYTKPVEKLKPKDITPKFNGRSYNNRRTIYAKKPVESTPSIFARNAYQGVKSGGTIYSKPYQFNGNMAGLKMATSGYPAYDEFYNYNYIYSYKFRNPQRGVADFPQSKLGIQRYMRYRTDALTRKMRLRAEYDIENINSLKGVTPQNRLQNLKLHWWMR